MNRIITSSIIIVSAAIVVGSVFAQTKSASPTVTPSPTPGTTEKSIENLKEKIANKVEELRKENKNVVAGTIAKINKDSVDITTDNQKTITVSIDDTLTTLYDITSGKEKEIKFDSLDKEDYIVVSGPVVETTVNANIIYIDTPVTVAQGHITNIDKDNFTIDVVTSEKEELTLDIETTTKQTIMDVKTLDIKTVGFSKIKIGDTIHFSARSGKDDKKKSAIRIFIIPQEYFAKPSS